MDITRLKTKELKNYGESYEAFISFLLSENKEAVDDFLKVMAKQTDSSNLWKLRNKFKVKSSLHKEY